MSWGEILKNIFKLALGLALALTAVGVVAHPWALPFIVFLFVPIFLLSLFIVVVVFIIWMIMD